MPFRALFDGRPLTTIGMDEARWTQIADAARRAPARLSMRCCGANAVSCVSPLGRRFFRHRRQAETCDWAPESDEHLGLKEAVARAVVEAGWGAEVEAIGPDWKADVMAMKGDARVAFEIQLSPQGKAETARREARYLAAGVTPWWIVNLGNAGDGFGGRLRLALKGKETQARLDSVGRIVADALKRIEATLDVAAAVGAALTRRGIAHEAVTFGAATVAYRAKLADGREQEIRIGDLLINDGFMLKISGASGPDPLPNPPPFRGRESLRASSVCSSPLKGGRLGGGSGDAQILEDRASIFPNESSSDVPPWGAIPRFMLRPTGTKVDPKRLFLKPRVAISEADAILGRLLSGELVWRGPGRPDLIEASFVRLDETCPRCRAEFVRIPYVIQAHRKIWPGRPPSLAAFDRLPKDVLTTQIALLSKRLGRKIGAIVHRRSGDPAGLETPMRQLCPACKTCVSDASIGLAEALAWPFPETDFHLAEEPKQIGWIAPDDPTPRERPSMEAWKAIVRKARAPQAELALWKAARERDEAAVKEQDWRRALGGARDAARQADGLEKAGRFACAMREERLAQARETLRRSAVRAFRDGAKAELWLNAHHPGLGGKPRDLCLDRYEACVKALKRRS